MVKKSAKNCSFGKFYPHNSFVHLILLHFFPFLAHYGIPLAAAVSHHLISAKTAQLDFSRIAFHLGQLHNAHRSCITGDGEA